KSLNLGELQGIICRLPEFFKETIITTNYDDLLKQIYADQDIHFDQVLFGIDAEEFKKLFGEGYRILLKLYGSFISKNKRVLTQDDYPKTLF
ncbi:SIR2 family protein, partial [Haemophilus influenzae]